jgi:hypothetical protein
LARQDGRVIPSVENHRAGLSLFVESDFARTKCHADGCASKQEKLLKQKDKDNGGGTIHLHESFQSKIERNQNSKEEKKKQVKSQGAPGIPEDKPESATHGLPGGATVVNNRTDASVV